LFGIVILLFFLFLEAASCIAGEQKDRLVIYEKDIKKANVLKIYDLLNHIPGVKAGETSVSIRGSSKVKVLLDGRSINDPTAARGAVKWNIVSLSNVEKVEIYKGEGGVEFGDDSSGGVIVITTKKIEAFSGNVESYWGNYKSEYYSSNCRGRKGPLGMGVSSSYEATDGFRKNGHKEKYRIGTRLQYFLNKDYDFTLTGDYLNYKKGVPGLVAFPTPNAGKDREMYSYLFLANLNAVKSKTWLNDAETKNINPDKNLDKYIRVKKMGEELNTRLFPGKAGGVNIGTGYELAMVKGSSIDSHKENKCWVFGSKSLTMKKIPVTFTFGLRSIFYSEYDDVINPEFTAGFKQKRYSIKFLANITNNLPTFYQRYNETSSTMPNPDLVMEKAQNYSLSLSAQLFSDFSFNLTPFYNKIRDRITYVRGDDGMGRYENFGEVTYKGVETSSIYKPFKPLLLKSSYTYLIAKDAETDKYISCKPKHKIKTDVFYSPVKRLSMICSMKYTSKTFTRSNNLEYAPGFFLLDFRSEYKVNGINPFFEIKNMFNKDYMYVDGYPGSSRTWIAGFNFEF